MDKTTITKRLNACIRCRSFRGANAQGVRCKKRGCRTYPIHTPDSSCLSGRWTK